MPDQDRIQQRIENAIERGIRNGDFDNLPGAGKPLDLGDPHDENWWIKKYAQREGLNLAECLPPTVALRKEADHLRANLAAFPNVAALRAAIDDLNARIVADRKALHRGPNPFTAYEIDADDAIQQWRRAQSDRADEVADQTPQPCEMGSGVNEPVAVKTQSTNQPWWRRVVRSLSGAARRSS